MDILRINDLRKVTIHAFEEISQAIEHGYNPLKFDISDNAKRYQGGHHHLVPELFVQLDGISRLARDDFDSALIQLDQGACLLIPPGIPHSEQIDCGAKNIVVKIIDGRLCYHCSIGNNHKQATRLNGEVVSLAYFRSTSGLLEDIAEGRLPLNICALIFRQLAHELTMAADPGAGSSLLAACQDRVEHCLHDTNLSVSGLAADLGCHPDHLSRLAKKAWGMPLVRWINERRLLRARAMLATPTRSIAEVAESCGFSDSRYFARVFSQAHNCSPSAWRNQMTPKQPPTNFTIPD